ncbi:FlgO family outer membrane protein [Rheinheimera marina]|uniref:FlgO family outer membrane protein n=1 Tax=Rheinheimera marina TaxID=1774958 RepID=A0ABV9JRS9_9GAMM
MCLLTGCSLLPDGQETASPTARSAPKKAEQPLLFYTERLADQLFAELGPIAIGQVAVVTFVDADTLKPEPAHFRFRQLGLQLQESMQTVASQLGYQVVELRATNQISLYAEHEQGLSRELAELAKQQQVRFVIAGTMTQGDYDTTVNAKLVDTEHNRVIAAASNLIPQLAFDQNEKVRMRQDKLYRLEY